MNTPKNIISFFLKFFANYFALILGSLLGYGGSMFVAFNVFDTNIGKLFANIMTTIFPYRFFVFQGYGWLFILYILVFLIGVWFLIRTSRKVIALFVDIRTKLDSIWLEYLKTYFAFGFWMGICLFIFIWIIIMPIFVYPRFN
jgi:hypothetical protein